MSNFTLPKEAYFHDKKTDASALELGFIHMKTLKKWLSR